MRELDIKISYQCNNHCLFCLNREKRGFNILFEDIKKQIISFSRKIGYRKLIISGGEPMINKNIFSLLDLANKTGIRRIEIQSNGRLFFYKEIVAKVSCFKGLEFLISFHFPSRRLYKKYCRTDGFNQVVEGIRNLIHNGFSVTINTVIMKPNLEYLSDIVNQIKFLGVRNFQFRFIDGHSVPNFSDFVPFYSECAGKIKDIIVKNPDLNIYLRGIPLCVLGKKFEKYLAPLNKQRLNLAISNRLLTTDEILRSQFLFSDKCPLCFYRRKCFGISKEYYQFYGDKEIKPLLK